MNDAANIALPAHIPANAVILGHGITFAAVYAVPCTKCGVPAGLGCRTPTAYNAKLHGVRIAAAKRLTVKAA